ncbi:response regulator, partial [Streptomyces sp. NPDC048279]|uniref:response regulator n=1 Tax=Streptomyces sp. NPDC048279 TaxID=3154714 RepID=UPI0034179BC0
MDVNGNLADTTVLIVDDEAASRYAMGTVLRRAGHEVVPVARGQEALSEVDVRLRKGRLPDVALIDVHLPDMSGFELCRRLRERPHMAGLPVVHFSAQSAVPADRCQGLETGAEAYLTVPAEPEDIEAAVRAAVRAARLRADDQALVRRLRLLSETIVAIQSARSLHELADAAADGAARLLGCPAAVFVLDR